LKEQFDFDENEMLYISAKDGTNVDLVLKAIVERISSPNKLNNLN
jgi:translation elongation factor EF-4